MRHSLKNLHFFFYTMIGHLTKFQLPMHFQTIWNTCLKWSLAAKLLQDGSNFKLVETRSVETKILKGTLICKCVTHSLTAVCTLFVISRAERDLPSLTLKKQPRSPSPTPYWNRTAHQYNWQDHTKQRSFVAIQYNKYLVSQNIYQFQ